jgi:Ca2+-binding RTX toxin-like protein
MATNALVMKAILAMDSYNHGYGMGINGLGGVGTYIGTAQITKQSDTVTGTDGVNAGFYGIAYTYGGQTVISYRGTDELVGWNGSDLYNGFGVAIGRATGDQSRLAFEFYNSVADALGGAGANDPRQANISLTGHSLGGGLAGLVGAVYGKTGVLFDNMPFEDTAQTIVTYSNPNLAPPTELTFGYNSALKETVYGSLVDITHLPWALNLSALRTYHVEGEFLQSLRAGQQTPQTPYSLGSNVDLVTGLDDFAAHSMATLAIRMYADPANGNMVPNTEWNYSAKYFWKALYDETFVRSLAGITHAGQSFFGLTGSLTTASNLLAPDGDYASILRTVIAYSAIDEGTRVFGDTGIKALYNDANDLGKALVLPNASTLLTAHAGDIAKAFVQFSGLLALKQILLANNSTAADGVLTFSDVAGNKTLNINFTDSLWASANGGTVPGSVARTDLVNGLLVEVGDINTIRSLMTTAWGRNDFGVFDRVSFATTVGEASVMAGGSANGQAGLFVSSGNDTSGASITGTAFNDMIIGGNGFSLLYGGGGNDILFGGVDNSNDNLQGGTGNDVLDGGLGQDFLYGGMGNDILRPGASYNDQIYGEDAAPVFERAVGFDTLDLSGVTLGLNVVMGSYETYNTSDNTILGRFFGIEQINTGSGADTFDLSVFNTTNSQEYRTIVADAAAGVDSVTLRQTMTVTTDTIFSDRAFILKNFETIQLSGSITNAVFYNGNGDINILGLGHNYVMNNGAGFMNYAAYNSALTIDMSGLTVTDGLMTDTLSAGAASKIVGSNFGDTVTFTGDRYFWSGRGNDVITVASTSFWLEGEVVYSAGQDRIANAHKLSKITLASDITAADVTFSQTNIRNVTFSGSTKTYLADFVVNIAGHGTLTLTDRTLTANVNTNQLISGNMTPISLWDQRYFNVYAAGNPLVGTAIARPLVTPYDDILVNEGFGGSGHDTMTTTSTTGASMNGGYGNDMLTGGTGADILHGDYGNDSLYGLDNIDTLHGGHGDDFLSGGLGNDYLMGEFGNDTLQGDEGNDTLNGGLGNDNFIFTLGQDLIYDEGGIDTLSFGVGIEVSNLTFASVNGYLQITKTAGIDEIYIAEQTTAKNIIDNLQFSDGFSVALSGYTSWNFTGTGTSRVDTLIGTTTANTIAGNDGDDIAYGGGGNDTITGGLGLDKLWGGDGNDSLDGGASNDRLIGGAGDDKYIYLSGADKGMDTINDTSGAADWISFGSAYTLANITLTRVGQYDLAVIGAGTQRLLIENQFTQNGSLERIRTGDGFDINLTTYVHTVDGTSANETLYGTSYGAGGDTLNGLGGDDVIYAGLGNDIVNGGDGNDTLYGEGGNDALNGGIGNDNFVYDSGIDTLTDTGGTDQITILTTGLTLGSITLARNGTQNLDVLINSTLSLTLTNQFVQDQGFEQILLANGSTLNLLDVHFTTTGTSGDDTLTGLSYGAGGDIINGLGGNDTINAGLGDDTLDGGLGDDTLYGQAGNDTCVFASGIDHIVETTTDGTDAVTYSARASTGVISWTDATGLYIQSTANAADRICIDSTLTATGMDSGQRVESITFSDVTWNLANGLTLNDNGTGRTMYGSAQADTMNLNGGNDTAYGYGGDDTINGGTGTDIIYGGDGNDTLIGDVGYDTLYGDAGNDLLWGDGGKETMYGGTGADTFKFATTTFDATIDLIKDFSTTDGDKLNIHDILTGYDPLTSNIVNFIELTTSGANTVMKIDRDGTGSTYSWTQIATIEGITGLTDEQALLTGGTIVA